MAVHEYEQQGGSLTHNSLLVLPHIMHGRELSSLIVITLTAVGE